MILYCTYSWGGQVRIHFMGQNKLLRKPSSIKYYTLGASILPALTMFVVLAPAFLYHYTQSSQESLTDKGQMLARQLSYMSEYALLTNDFQYVRNYFLGLLDQTEVYSLKVTDAHDSVLLDLTRPNVGNNTPALLTFRHAIEKSINPVTVDLFHVPQQSVKQSPLKTTGNPLGEVNIRLSTRKLEQQRSLVMLYGLLIALFALLVSGFIGRILGNRVLLPIEAIISGVKRIRRGDYSHAINTNSRNEISVLAGDINALANELQKAQVEIERTIAELMQARDEADRSAASKSDFLALISHEIRSPLGSAFGVIELLEETELSKPQRRYIQLALNSFNHIINLLEDLSDFSSLEQNEIKISQAPVNVTRLVKQLVANYNLNAGDKTPGINYYHTGDANLHGKDMLCDGTRLRQILSNLLDNALENTPNGRVSIVTHWESRDSDNVMLHITLRDTGIGMPPERVFRIQQMFNQKTIPSRPRHAGTGFGLYIVKRLLTPMNGELNITSEAGCGTTVTLKIPVSVADHHTVSPTVNNQPVNDTRVYGRILVVEDDYANREVLKGFLTQVGISVDVADNGADGLEHFKQSNYDLVFIDCFMDKMDGFELARQMRKHEKQCSAHRTPLVAITASALHETQRKCMDSGMDDLITKPYRKFELYKRISAIYKTGKILESIRTTSQAT